MSSKLLFLTYFIYGIMIFYNAFKRNAYSIQKKGVKNYKISVFYTVPLWIMLMIEMFVNMWHE